MILTENAQKFKRSTESPSFRFWALFICLFVFLFAFYLKA